MRQRKASSRQTSSKEVKPVRKPSSAAATRRCAAVPSRLRLGSSATVFSAGGEAGRLGTASRRPRPRPPRRPLPPARDSEAVCAASRAKLASASTARDASGSGRAGSRLPECVWAGSAGCATYRAPQSRLVGLAAQGRQDSRGRRLVYLAQSWLAGPAAQQAQLH